MDIVTTSCSALYNNIARLFVLSIAQTALVRFFVDMHRGGATILRLGVQILLRAKPAENLRGCTLPHICQSWGTAAIKRGIRRAYRTALLQYLTGRARALIAYK